MTRAGAAGPGPVGGGARRPFGGPPSVPRVTLVLMAIFVLFGSIGLTLDWPLGPANLDWGVWVLVYAGYAYVIGAALFYARTGK